MFQSPTLTPESEPLAEAEPTVDATPATDDAPAVAPPVVDDPVAEDPDTPAADTPVAEDPATDDAPPPPADDAPADGAPTSDTPATDAPTDAPPADTPVADTPAAVPATASATVQTTEGTEAATPPAAQDNDGGVLTPLFISLLFLLIVLGWLHLYSLVRKLERRLQALTEGNGGEPPATGQGDAHVEHKTLPPLPPSGDFNEWKESVLPEDQFDLRRDEIMHVPANPELRVAPAGAAPVPASGRTVQELADFFNKAAQKGDRHLVLSRQDLADRVLWVLGDIHGCDTGLAASLSWINATMDRTRRNTIVFLGDLIDRAAPAQHLAVFNLLADAYKLGAEVIYLRGNHDDALAYDPETKRFTSTVIPSEFVDQLNADPSLRPLGLGLIRFFQAAPVSLCATYGQAGETIYMAHAGVPHDDVLQKWFESTDAAEADYPGGSIPASDFWVRDCIWARITTQLLKEPFRGIKGHELGRLNLRLFTRLFALRTGMKISAIVHGHEHPGQGYSMDEESAEFAGCHVITLSNLTADPAGGLNANRKPTILRWDVAAGTLELTPLSIG